MLCLFRSSCVSSYVFLLSRGLRVHHRRPIHSPHGSAGTSERSELYFLAMYIRDSMSQHATDTNDMMMSSGDFSATKAVANCARVSTAPHQSLADGGRPKDTKAGENLHTAGGAALTSSFRQTSLLPFSAHTVQYVGGAICIYSVRLRHRSKPSFPGYLPQGNQAKDCPGHLRR